ncbi:Regulator of RpoS [Candidatus Tiddalikarchaeum anstoanum]|nr:Regulator of RpoS [Candidatus Tiddalikarchaeum anstoanum]
MNALIVDDETIITKVLSSYLKKKECTCIIANDLNSAKYNYAPNTYVLILTDINLTRNGEEGIELIKYIKSINPDEEIYAMTGRPENEERILEAGAKKVIMKPFRLKTIDELINWN